MEILSTISFYLSLVFGFGFGIIGFLHIGRIGAVQFIHWLSGIPQPESSNKEDVKLLLSSAGIPTSLDDILASMSGLGGLKLFFDIFSYFSRNLRKTVYYFASIFGRFFSKIWVLIGIPAFIFDIVVSRTGHEYWPIWINEIGIQNKFQFFIAIVSSYGAAYIIGRMIGSPQRSFNKARIIYERVVADKGYWFDNRNAPQHYIYHKNYLEKAKHIYDRLFSSLEKQANNDLRFQRIMTLYYQRALLLSTLGEYNKAEHALIQARKYKSKLAGSRIWEPNEELVFESQLLFLEGELAYIQGYNENAREKFNKSREIDISLHDKDGIARNDERLQLIKDA